MPCHAWQAVGTAKRISDSSEACSCVLTVLSPLRLRCRSARQSAERPDFASFFGEPERPRRAPSPSRKSGLQASICRRILWPRLAETPLSYARHTQDLVVDSDFVTIFC